MYIQVRMHASAHTLSVFVCGIFIFKENINKRKWIVLYGKKIYIFATILMVYGLEKE